MSQYDFKKVVLHFVEIKLWDGCSPVHLLHIFKTPFFKNTSGGLLLIASSVGSQLKSSNKIFI